MPERDARHPSPGPGPGPRRDGRWLRRGSAGLVLAVLAAGVASAELDLGHRLGIEAPSPVREPALVQPPPGLDLPAAGAPARVAPAATEGDVDGAAVRRTLAPLLRSKKLGPHVRVAVAELDDGREVYRNGGGVVTPASTMKLLTSLAALQTLGPGHRFATTVVATPSSPRIVLVGGGDPLLGSRPASAATYPARADVATLARSTARALRAAGRSSVRLGYDASLFSGPAVNPHWEPSYVPDGVVSPISALWVDEGRGTPGLAVRAADPAAAAAGTFADALERDGIKVRGRVAPAKAPDEAAGGQPIATVRSAPLDEIVQHVLEVSDNEGAEVLSRQVGIATGRAGSFTGGAAGVTAVLRRLGVDLTDARIFDGSGLSRQDRLRPETLLAVLRTAAAADHPGLRSVVTDLPVAGFSGSLTYRFDTGEPRALGLVRAKTGTLTGVHGLAGTAVSRDGAVMVFAVVADRVRLPDNLAARIKVDELAAALAGCRCASTP